MSRLKSPSAPVALQTSEFKDSLQPQDTANKKQIESTLAQLKQWLALNKDTPKLDMPLLSRLSLFGLRSPEDVRIFLETPAGESVVKAWLDDMLIEIAAMENAAFEQREHLHHKKLLATFLILGLLYKHNAHAHELIDHTLQELSKKLHGESKTAAPEPSPIEQNRHDFNSYAHPIQQIEEMLHRKIEESKELELKLADMEPLYQEIQANYTSLKQHLDEAHEIFEKLKGSATTKATSEEPSLAVKTENLINALTEQISANTNAVVTALENNEETKARELMHKGNALNMQVAALREMASVTDGKSLMYNEKHELTTSFSDAAYILAVGTKIVEKNGTHYLLQANQKLEDMTAEDISAAEKQFKKLKPAETMSIRQLVQHNHRLENAPREALSARSDQLQQELLLLAQQLSTLQESRSNAELSLKPAPALKMTPISPSAAPTPSPNARPASKELVESYEHVIRLMSNDPGAIRRLQDGFTRANPSSLLKQQLYELKPGMPIPQATMNNMLAMPNVGQTLLGIKNPDVEKGTSPSPSPFRIKPRGMV